MSPPRSGGEGEAAVAAEEEAAAEAEEAAEEAEAEAEEVEAIEDDEEALMVRLLAVANAEAGGDGVATADAPAPLWSISGTLGSSRVISGLLVR